MGEYDAGTRMAIDKMRKDDRDRRIRKLNREDQLLARELAGDAGAGGSLISRVAAKFYGAGGREGAAGSQNAGPSLWF